MHEQLQDITYLIAFGCLLLMLLTGIAHYSRRSRLPAEAWTLIIGLGAGLTAKFTAFDLTPYAIFFLFFMLGVAVGTHEFVVTLWSMMAAVFLLFLSRMIIVYGGFGILRIFRIKLSLFWQTAIMLSGLRGPVSAALILTLPESFPYKGEFQCLAFVAITASLILQPLLIQALLHKASAAEHRQVQD